MDNRIKLFITDERAAGVVEYVLLASFIAAVIVSVVITLGGTVADDFQKVINAYTVSEFLERHPLSRLLENGGTS